MPVCFLNSLPNDEYSNLLSIEAFSNSTSSDKTSSSVKNPYLPSFSDGKAEILAFCLSKLY